MRSTTPPLKSSKPRQRVASPIGKGRREGPSLEKAPDPPQPPCSRPFRHVSWQPRRTPGLSCSRCAVVASSLVPPHAAPKHSPRRSGCPAVPISAASAPGQAASWAHQNAFNLDQPHARPCLLSAAMAGRRCPAARLRRWLHPLLPFAYTRYWHVRPRGPLLAVGLLCNAGAHGEAKACGA